MNNLDRANSENMKQEIVGVYDRAAPIYSRVGIKQFTYFGHLLVERLQIPTGAQVLDIASGRGAILFPAAEKVGASGHVRGIDLAPTMVAETKAEIQQRGIKQAEIVLMDADNVVFPDHTFDYVTCGFALHFLNYEQTLPKLLGILKPGGCFAATMPYVPLDENLTRWQWLLDLTRAVFPPDFVPPPAWVAPNRLNKPELAEAALRTAGFQNIHTEKHEVTLYFKDEEDWWSWEWSQASRFWLEGMSQEGLARFKQESFANLKKMLEPQGIATLMGGLFVIGYKPQ